MDGPRSLIFEQSENRLHLQKALLVELIGAQAHDRDSPMTEALYERYKEALRRGHVAAQRGRLDEALDAYGEAGRVARTVPSRWSASAADPFRQADRGAVDLRPRARPRAR